MNLEEEFPIGNQLIYLNHAAVSPWPKRTTEAVKQFAEAYCQTGSLHYLDWLEKESYLRQQLKALLNAESTDDIALVKNTSEALSFVAYGLSWKPGDNIIISDEEFPSNRICWQSLSDQGVEVKQASLDEPENWEDNLLAQVDSNTRLISISSIQFATGKRLDIEKMGAFCKANKILFCIDAIQSLGAVKFDVMANQADFVMADGHKWMFGPEGLGVFYTRPEVRNQLKLTQFGWHMMADTHDYENKPWEIHPGSQRFECGSPNMLGIHAWSASLSLLLEIGMDAVEARVLENAMFLKNQIKQNPSLQLLTTDDPARSSGIILFKHVHIENRKLYKQLQQHNIMCAMRGGGIRLSPHFYNTHKELEQVIKILESFE